MTKKYTREDQIEAFFSKVNKIENGCWIWTSSLDEDGYGRFVAGGVRCRAHRFSWEIVNGKIPKGFSVLHNCPGGDNPSCVNPTHLWLGDGVENMKDRLRKGNYPTGDNHPLRIHPEKAARGEDSGKTKFTNKIIIEIRRLYNTGKYSHPQLGKMFGSSHSTIGRIIRREVWKHI